MPKAKRARGPEPVVGTYILDRKNRLLLIRGYKWGDQWLIPGGHIEHGESVFDAARREAKEEVGLDIVPLGVVTVFEDIFPKDFHERDRHFLYFETFCRAAVAKVRMDNDEVSEYKWFSLEDAKRAVTNPTIRKTIATYMAWAKSGRYPFIRLRP